MAAVAHDAHGHHDDHGHHEETFVSKYIFSQDHKMIAKQFGGEFDLKFANGGDQNNDTIPEKPICEEMNVALIDGLGDKIQSSSWLLKKL